MGDNEVITVPKAYTFGVVYANALGATFNVNVAELVEVPKDVVTANVPETALAGTVKVILVNELTV